MPNKIQTYNNPNYCLSIDGDVVFLDVKIKITQENEKAGVYSMEVEQAQLSPAEEAVLIKACSLMTSESLTKFYDFINEKLTEEMTPSLFNYFYSGT